MFPTLDREVVEVVLQSTSLNKQLESSGGNLEEAVNMLLQMCSGDQACPSQPQQAGTALPTTRQAQRRPLEQPAPTVAIQRRWYGSGPRLVREQVA